MDTIRNKDVNSLESNHYRIPLHHSPLYNLLNTDSRTEFIRHIIALIRMVAAGEANVGHLRKDGTEIHRKFDASGNPVDESVEHPPQQEMDEKEESSWRLKATEEYTS